MTEIKTKDFQRVLVEDLGYKMARKMDDGNYIGAMDLLFTRAICVIEPGVAVYRQRYCFEDIDAFQRAYEGMKAADEVPSGWVAARTLVDAESIPQTPDRKPPAIPRRRTP
ncbi:MULTISPECIES: hypothetical protein [unclassified Thioalkalivibrio]|uniref:hypothetical protein n=1 Tax=unclassified Thioalkalivibrio TaxID=2621013 RepID=UPI00037B1B64|nr:MULTISPECIES: hypothetical protein [unclassified Thioalkalivibrio]